MKASALLLSTSLILASSESASCTAKICGASGFLLGVVTVKSDRSSLRPKTLPRSRPRRNGYSKFSSMWTSTLCSIDCIFSLMAARPILLTLPSSCLMTMDEFGTGVRPSFLASLAEMMLIVAPVSINAWTIRLFMVVERLISLSIGRSPSLKRPHQGKKARWHWCWWWLPLSPRVCRCGLSVWDSHCRSD